MSECDICKGCKCGEVALLRKEVERLKVEIKDVLIMAYGLVDKLEEVKKCR